MPLQAIRSSPLWGLIRSFSWQELRQHPWRSAAAIAAVMLGVALAFSVHLINASALDEFAQAARSVSGQADLILRARQGRLDEQLYTQVALHDGSAEVAPLLEINTLLLRADLPPVALRVIAVDALRLGQLSPELLPLTDAGMDRMAGLQAGQVFLNASAQALVGETRHVRLKTPSGEADLQRAGRVMASGPPLAVMDIAAGQDLFDAVGQLSRLDVRLAPGVDRQRYLQSLSLPAQVLASEPEDAAQRVNQLSRAYRVNLTVLALVALFTGGFLVFSVLSLSVARRTRQFALLGVLGLRPQEGAQLVLAESLLLGLLGSALGLALGTGLAALALQLLGGDLGGGYFAGASPPLQWSPAAAALYGGLGVAAALLGGWWPARSAAALAPAQALKGLGQVSTGARRGGAGLGLMAMAGLLALLPPWQGIPLGAYFAVALLLLGGIVLLPELMGWTYAPLARRLERHVLPLLAVERARRVNGSAASAISGVVASLSLAVALTVMVSSFRGSVIEWLDQVLPAPLYLRANGGAQASDVATLSPAQVERIAALPHVAAVSGLRLRPLLLSSGQPNLTLIARSLDPQAGNLPLIGKALPVPAGQIGVYVSEAVLDLYPVQLGQSWDALATAFQAQPTSPVAPARFFVAGVWRDYARQFGSVVMGLSDYQTLSGDYLFNDLGLWLDAPEHEAEVVTALNAQAAGQFEISSSAEIRRNSLRIFDRSFAVTYWLQAVAIGIGLFGVAANFSAQVLARRKEFGLLAHLGLTRRQILTVVAGEGLVWTGIGALAGLLLGLAVSLLLVKVVNPQSFHWSMELHLPWARLIGLCAATVAAGTLTAWFSGRAAVGQDAVMAVREDW
ncbi:ABC transporter permease [Curvibacter sp. HBC28]|uniref:ABC transporter permease n=1 Tax=Curvibacter microcysteis TaxID=3026419 RepID=A0ABT5MM11_9BURK|nr:ABC transporter permease [Curvibacter sp. HBC28]MDD0816884.1 ABC transporter permease [Curvibacter sp. HBC28]